MRFSLEGKLALFGFALVAVVAALVAFLSRWLGSPWLAFLVGVAVATPLVTHAAGRRRWHCKPDRSRLQREHRHDESARADVAGRRLQPPRQCAARRDRKS